MRLTKKRLDGLLECALTLEVLQQAGWEGTPQECRIDDCPGCERCELRQTTEEGLAYLNWFIAKRQARAKK